MPGQQILTKYIHMEENSPGYEMMVEEIGKSFTDNPELIAKLSAEIAVQTDETGTIDRQQLDAIISSIASEGAPSSDKVVGIVRRRLLALHQIEVSKGEQGFRYSVKGSEKNNNLDQPASVADFQSALSKVTGKMRQTSQELTATEETERELILRKHNLQNQLIALTEEAEQLQLAIELSSPKENKK